MNVVQQEKIALACYCQNSIIFLKILLLIKLRSKLENLTCYCKLPLAAQLQLDGVVMCVPPFTSKGILNLATLLTTHE